MARVVDPAAHAQRKDSFVDAAIRLIQTKGYEGTSLQDVLDQAEASRGAFYHYFDSKAELLDAVLERMVDTVVASLEPLVRDPEVPAILKLQRFFSGITRWKEERRELILSLTKVWLSDENAIVREHLRVRTSERLTPLMAEIIGQGDAEGTFMTNTGREVASVLISLALAAQEAAIRLFIARRNGTASYQEVERTLAAYAEAFERILGIPTGSWPVTDEATMRFWFAD